jgi:siroheme synthase
MLVLAGNEAELQLIDPAHLPDVLESLAQAKAVTSQPTLKSTTPSAASINEVSVQTARRPERRRDR